VQIHFHGICLLVGDCPPDAFQVEGDTVPAAELTLFADTNRMTLNLIHL